MSFKLHFLHSQCCFNNFCKETAIIALKDFKLIKHLHLHFFCIDLSLKCTSTYIRPSKPVGIDCLVGLQIVLHLYISIVLLQILHAWQRNCNFGQVKAFKLPLHHIFLLCSNPQSPCLLPFFICPFSLHLPQSIESGHGSRILQAEIARNLQMLQQKHSNYLGLKLHIDNS